MGAGGRGNDSQVELQALRTQWKKTRRADAVIDLGVTYRFEDLEDEIERWAAILAQRGVGPGEVVGLRPEYSFPGISLFLALLANGNIVALVPPAAIDEAPYLRDGRIASMFRFEGEAWSWERLDPRGDHELLHALRDSQVPGFIIFSSGSTGTPKASLHRLDAFLAKFDRANKQYRTLAFLLFDHIAGIDTLFYVLASGGALILPEQRGVEYICRIIEEHRVEVLPASPTFLRLLCLSDAPGRHDLSSLRIVTYGSEPMDQATLAGSKPSCQARG